MAEDTEESNEVEPDWHKLFPTPIIYRDPRRPIFIRDIKRADSVSIDEIREAIKGETSGDAPDAEQPHPEKGFRTRLPADEQ